MSGLNDFIIEAGLLEDYLGDDETVVIPYGVTEIGIRAFFGCDNIKEVIIPDGITTIGEEAFCYCSSLVDITIPETVKEIGKHAFAFCKSLEAIVIPDSVTNVGAMLFSGCAKLTSVKLSQSLKCISSSMFNFCTSLEAITLPAGLESIGGYAFSHCAGLKSILIPNGVTKIGSSAFCYCSKLETVKLPDSLITMGEGVFVGCENLADIKVPDCVTSIGDGAFSKCKRLVDENGFVIVCNVIHGYYGTEKDVVIPEGVTGVCFGLFHHNTKMVSVTFPESLTTVYKSMFEGCSNLKTVKFSSSIKSIDEKAFFSCKSLASVTIPKNVTDIDSSAFEGCDSLVSISVDEMNSVFSSTDGVLFDKTGTILVVYPYGKNEDLYTVPDRVESISEKAFYGCKKLKSIKLSDNLKDIGKSAFSRCENLTSVVIPDSVEYIDENAFYNCKRLKFLKIPDTLTNIDSSAFRDCSQLVNENNLVVVNGVLYECLSARENITIPDDVMYIDDMAFFNKRTLKTITFHAGIKSIGECAFEYCEKLTTINLPGNIENYKGSALEVIWNHFIKSANNVILMLSFITQVPDVVLNNENIYRMIKNNRKQIMEFAIETDNLEAIQVLFDFLQEVKLDELNEYLEKTGLSVNVKAFLLNYKNKNYSKEKQERYEIDLLEKELGLKERTISDWGKIYNFFLEGDKVLLLSYKGESSYVIIPEKIGEYTVYGIDSYAFSATGDNLPKAIREKREKIHDVVIPGSVTRIEKSAFEGCENLTIHAPVGSCAEKFAKKGRFNFIAV